MKLELREVLAAAHSRIQTDRIVRWVEKDQRKFAELFRIFNGNETRLAQRASWVLSIILSSHPSLLKNYYRDLLNKLKTTGQHNAIYRNGLKAIGSIDIPEEFEGEVMDLCFKMLASPDRAIAVQAHALSILEQLAKKHPEIIPEIKTITDIHITEKTAALRVRTRWLNKG
jgi:hypothetical protein